MQRYFICFGHDELWLFIKGVTSHSRMDALRAYSKTVDPNKYLVLTPQEYQERDDTRG